MPVYPGQLEAGGHQFLAGFDEPAIGLDVVADRMPGVLAIGQAGAGGLQPQLAHLACPFAVVRIGL